MAIDLVAVLRLDDQMTQSMKKVALGATAGFAAITAGVVASVKTFATFDSAVRKAGAIAGASSSEFDALKEAAIELGSSTSKSATEVANSMTELAAAGFEVNDILGAMPGVIAASEASGESLALAAETVGSALSIWSLKAEESTHVADVLAMSANMSKASINDMAYAFKYAGAPAAALKISLEELSAAVGIITNAGIDGSTAGTALRSGLMALSSPLEKQQKLMNSIGFSANHANGETKTLSEMIRGLSASLEGMTDAGKVGVLKDLVGTEAVSAFLSLVSAGADELDVFTKALVNSDGAAAKTAKEMMAGIGGAFEELGGFIESAMIRVGDAIDEPLIALARLATNVKLDPLFSAFDLLGDLAMKVINVFKNNWKTLGPIITPILGLLGSFVAALGLIGGGVAVFAALSAVIGFISGPIALIAAAIALVGTSFTLAYQKSKLFRQAIDGIGSAFKSISHIFTGEHKAAIDVLKSAGFSEEQISLIRKFGYSMKDAFDKLKGIFQSTAHIFTGEHKAAIDVLKSAGFTEEQIETIRSFGYGLKSAFDKVVEIFDGLGTMMMGGGSSDFLAALGLSPEAINNITSFVNTIKTQLGEVIPFIKEKFEQMRPTFEMLQNAFKKVQGVVMEVFPAVWSVLEPILSNVWSSIQRVADVATWAFNNIIVPGLALLSAAFSAVWSIIGPILELIGAAIKLSFEVLKIVWDTIIAPFAENLTGIFAKAVELAIPIVEKIGGVFEKIGGLISAAAGKISNFAETLKSVKVPGWIGKIGSGAASFASNIFGGGKKDGSHYNGIGRIGWDGYIAELHAGERVLNRFEADQYDAIMGGEMQVAGVSDFKHEARSVNNTTINQNTTNSSGIDTKPTQGSTSISIAKLADSIVVREDADVTRIADELVAKILEKRGVTA